MGRESVHFSAIRSCDTRAASSRHFLVIAAAVLALGCAGPAGPVGGPEFEPALRTSLDLEGEGVEVSGQAEWYPHTHGLDDLRDDFKARNLRSVSGALIFTNSRILMVEWDPEAKRYRQVMTLPYDQLLSCDLEKRGRLRLLIVQRRDLAFHTFQTTIAEEAADFLRATLTRASGE